jgi:hypothetical protein
MAKHALSPNQNAPFPTQGILYDLGSEEVDATDWIWALNHPVKRMNLNFARLQIPPGPMLDAIATYIADKIADASPDDVRNHFDNLVHLHKCPHFLDCLSRK